MDIIRFLLFKLSCGHWESHTYKYICITILHQINRNKVILWIVLNYNSSNACTQNGTKLQWWCSKGIPIAVSLLGMFFFFCFQQSMHTLSWKRVHIWWSRFSAFMFILLLIGYGVFPSLGKIGSEGKIWEKNIMLTNNRWLTFV